MSVKKQQPGLVPYLFRRLLLKIKCPEMFVKKTAEKRLTVLSDASWQGLGDHLGSGSSTLT